MRMGAMQHTYVDFPLAKNAFQIPKHTSAKRRPFFKLRKDI